MKLGTVLDSVPDELECLNLSLILNPYQIDSLVQRLYVEGFVGRLSSFCTHQLSGNT